MSRRSTFRNLLLFGAAGAVTFGAVVLVDRLYGKHLQSSTQNLLYPAYSGARMRTSEFDLVYHINNLGFRGPDVDLEKSDKPRIAFIGDSFTFGWGVEEEKSWIGLLRNEHPDLELLNLGRGGTHPMDNAQLARKVLPILKPDHVFVCLTSWNDLIQMQRVLDVEAGAELPAIPNFRIDLPASSRFVQRWFPSISKKFRAPADINQRWKMEADWIAKTFPEKLKTLTLSDQVRADFENGLLNPSGIYDRIMGADAETRLCTTDSLVLSRTSIHLQEIETVCSELGTGLTFVVLPNRPTGCPECMSDLKNLGADLPENDSCLVIKTPEIHLQGIEPIHHFPLSETSDLHLLYYPLDGHLTPTGNRAVSEWLSPLLARLSEPSE